MPGQNNRSKGKGGGGGGGSRVFVSLPLSGNAVEKTPNGAYRLRFHIGQTNANPLWETPVKIFFQDKQVALINVRKSEDHVLDNIKPDLSKPLILKVEKAGFSGTADSIEFNKDDFESLAPPASQPSAPSQNRLQVIVGRMRLDGKNPVTIILKNPDPTDEENRKVEIDAGQPIELWGNTFDDGTIVTVPEHGRLELALILLEESCLVQFTHTETNESHSELLLSKVHYDKLCGSKEKGEVK